MGEIVVRSFFERYTFGCQGSLPILDRVGAGLVLGRILRRLSARGRKA
jgi:hypothetical protein